MPFASDFGDNNRAALRAGMNVIIRRLKWEDAVDEFDGKDVYVLAAVMEAVQWLWDGGEPPSADWSRMIVDHARSGS